MGALVGSEEIWGEKEGDAEEKEEDAEEKEGDAEEEEGFLL